MNGLINKLYLKSPYIIKRVLANTEAIRRDFYRKFDRDKQLNEDLDIMQSVFNTKINFDLDRTNELFTSAKKHVEYYKNYTYNDIKSVEDFEKLPLLTKEIVRERVEDLVSNKINYKRSLWKGISSGSTGTPLKYFRDKKSVKLERNAYESYYKYCGCDITKNRVRISGVKVAEFHRNKPPYWLFIDRYKQLQCSAYHISNSTFKEYLSAFEKNNADFATGFPSGWAALADLMLDNKITFNRFKAIITDSEGLSEESQNQIEKAFNCPVYKTYGLGEVGMCAVQCRNGKYHILPSHYIEIVDDNRMPLNDGEEGQIIVTDYNSFDFPFIRYATGDLGILQRNECSCGMKTPYLSKVTGRIEDYILTKDGRKITRLTSIVRKSKGIKESQIIQYSRNDILINIIPKSNFEPESMLKVVADAKGLIGDMNISWQVVNQLERMPSGKLKFLIRKI